MKEARHMITARNGRPPELKIRIAKVMADGRERTFADIARDIGCKTETQKRSAENAVREMQKVGLLVRENVVGVAIMRAAR